MAEEAGAHQTGSDEPIGMLVPSGFGQRPRAASGRRAIVGSVTVSE